MEKRFAKMFQPTKLADFRKTSLKIIFPRLLSSKSCKNVEKSNLKDTIQNRRLRTPEFTVQRTPKSFIHIKKSHKNLLK